MEDEVKELEEMAGSSQQEEEETPEQILEQIKAYLLQKFKEAGVEKYEIRQSTTGIVIRYDGQKVEITHPKRNVVELLTTNSLANFLFGQFIKGLAIDLDDMKRKRKKK